jgi:phage-related protein
MPERRPAQKKKIPVLFYATASGRAPVRDWLNELEIGDREDIGKDVLAAQMGWPLGLPLCRSLGEGLWEVRSTLSNRRIARIIFAFDEGEMVLLHGFIKKTQKTPRGDIELALGRLKEVTA